MKLNNRLRKLETSRQNDDDFLILIRRYAQSNGEPYPTTGYALPGGRVVGRMEGESEEELEARATCEARGQPFEKRVMVMRALRHRIILPDNGRDQVSALSQRLKSSPLSA